MNWSELAGRDVNSSDMMDGELNLRNKPDDAVRIGKGRPSSETNMPDLLNEIADALLDNDITTIEDLCIISESKPEPGDNIQNPAFRRESNCIGLASWALSDLYVEAKRQLLLSKGDVRVATAMLVVNPEHLRSWSIRKEHLSETSIATELAFSALILRRSPKSGEAWSHRAWVLRQVRWTSEVVENEFQIALAAATKAQSNYYAGVHRIRVLQRAEKNIVLKELAKNRTWLQMHVRDSSGWWYHNALLTRLITDENFNVLEETAFISDMHERYGGEYQCVRKQFVWWERQIAQS